MKVNDDDIAWLRAHVAQLTQTVSQLALPPCKEEARAKSWWQFWQRGYDYLQEIQSYGQIWAFEKD